MTSRSPLPPEQDTELLAEDDLRRRVKRELRKRARGVRKALPIDACDQRSARIVRQLLEHPEMKAARSVALFWPITERHEVDLRALDAELRTRGVRVAYPAIDPDAEGRRMRFQFVDDTTLLAEQGYGFAEPPREAEEIPASLEGLNVVVVPALAIDPTGQRIGYGAGYYDGALLGTGVVKIGVIFDFELVPEVPVTRGDVALDWIVTDRRVLDARDAEALQP